MATCALTATGVLAVSAPANAASTYDHQLLGGVGIYSIAGPDHAGAQAFVTADAHVSKLSALIVNQSDSGTLDAQIRTDVTDPASAIADQHIDIKALGGAGQGWVDFPVDATVTPGKTYYLVIQASGTSGKVQWNGVKSVLAGTLGTWNYDLSYWGGWKAYNDSDVLVSNHLAFGINLAGADSCSAMNACYSAGGDMAAETAGLLGNGTTTVALTPVEAAGASYVPDSNVLELPDGQWEYLPDGATTPVTVAANDPGAEAQISESRAWLASGTIPGRTQAEKDTAARALLSMRLLTQPNGSNAAGWYGAYKYSWPRDSSFVAVAFAETGHTDEAYRIIKYNEQTQLANGTWDARTKLDGSGPPDDRHWQLDADGWVPWSVWEWYQTAPTDKRDQLLKGLYPMVEKAADYSASSLDDRGLPPSEPDYGELPTSTTNIGTAAPLLSGLHAAAAISRLTGNSDAVKWDAAARRLSSGIAKYFAPLGYPRTLDGTNLDSAIAFMAPPFNEAPTGLAGALNTTYQTLLESNGGIRPYENHAKETYAAETGWFAVAWSAMGQQDKAQGVMDWLVAHRNALGELPEKVNSAGYSSTVTPLGWTDAVTVLALGQLDGTMIAVPPAPCKVAGPCTPAAPTAVAGDGQATVTVKQPSQGIPTSFTVTAAPGGATCVVIGASGSCTIKGLTNGVAYRFTATATNSEGTSEPSPESLPVTPHAATTGGGGGDSGGSGGGTSGGHGTATPRVNGNLADTGSDIGGYGAAGLLLLLAGVGTMVIRSRRRSRA